MPMKAHEGDAAGSWKFLRGEGRKAATDPDRPLFNITKQKIAMGLMVFSMFPMEGGIAIAPGWSCAREPNADLLANQYRYVRADRSRDLK